MPEKVDLSYIINLPPEKAVEYLRSKGYEISFSWREVWQEAHNRAFTVAKAMSVDLLQDIRGEVQKAIDKGTSFEEFRRNLEPVLKKKGWWGKSYMFDNEGNLQPVQLGSVERLETIYDTNLTVAYSVGRYKGQIDNVGDRPYWQYTAVMDRNTRPLHAMLNGLVFMYDDPFWDKYYPPNDWGCRCHVRALSKYDMEKKGLEVQNRPPDGFDPKEFAPEEWSYNPGATNLGLDDVMWKKIREIEEEDLRSQAIEAMVNAPNRKEMFSAFVDNVLESRQTRGQSQVVGWMDNDVIDYVEENYKKLTTPVIVISDKEILHLTRDTKTSRDAALSTNEIKSIPDVISNPVAVLWDTRDPALLYIVPSADKMQKIVIRVEYKFKGNTFNLIKSAGIVMNKNLTDQRYIIIKGKI